MSRRFVSSDGQVVVDIIDLTGTGTGRDGVWLRLKRHGTFAGEFRTTDELYAELHRFGIDPRDLTPEKGNSR